MKYILYTDGSCSGNPGPGGWGVFCVDDNGNLTESSGGSYETTNNAMELTAAIEGLQPIPKGSTVKVYTDSQYVINGITKWIKGWKRRNWHNAAGGPVANRVLWEALETVTQGKDVTWIWVKGHNGNPGNERADTLAQQQTQIYKKG